MMWYLGEAMLVSEIINLTVELWQISFFPCFDKLNVQSLPTNITIDYIMCMSIKMAINAILVISQSY